MKKSTSLWHNNWGTAVVEATILFPIMIMIFSALAMLAIYLPQRAVLQEAAQATAVALATTHSDTWVSFDGYANYVPVENVSNVYVSLVKGLFLRGGSYEDEAKKMGINFAAGGVFSLKDNVEVEFDVVNYILFQEVAVTVTQKIQMPVALPFIGFSGEITLSQEARAVIQNGDEFVRNIDIAKDLTIWLANKFGVTKKLKEFNFMDSLKKVSEAALPAQSDE